MPLAVSVTAALLQPTDHADHGADRPTDARARGLVELDLAWCTEISQVPLILVLVATSWALTAIYIAVIAATMAWTDQRTAASANFLPRKASSPAAAVPLSRAVFSIALSLLPCPARALLSQAASWRTEVDGWRWSCKPAAER